METHHDALSGAQDSLTWENFLLRGLKADPILWNAFKPKEISAPIWGELYLGIQALKKKHHIEIQDEIQQAQRATPPVWHNLDDPYALLQTSKEMFGKQPNGVLRAEEKGVGPIQLICDRAFAASDKPILASKNDCAVDIVALGCSLGQCTIEPSYIENLLVTHHHTEEILLYQIQLEPGMTLQPTMGHIHTQHLGRIYSTPIGPFTKEILKNQPVYVYEPHPNNSKLWVARPLIQTVHGEKKQVRMGDFSNYLASQSAVQPELSPLSTPAAEEQKKPFNNDEIRQALTTAISQVNALIQKSPRPQLSKVLSHLTALDQQLINTACSDQMLNQVQDLHKELNAARPAPSKKGPAFFDMNRESRHKMKRSAHIPNAMTQAIDGIEKTVNEVELAMKRNLGQVVIHTPT